MDDVTLQLLLHRRERDEIEASLARAYHAEVNEIALRRIRDLIEVASYLKEPLRKFFQYRCPTCGRKLCTKKGSEIHRTYFGSTWAVIRHWKYKHFSCSCGYEYARVTYERVY